MMISKLLIGISAIGVSWKVIQSCKREKSKLFLNTKGRKKKLISTIQSYDFDLKIRDQSELHFIGNLEFNRYNYHSDLFNYYILPLFVLFPRCELLNASPQRFINTPETRTGSTSIERNQMRSKRRAWVAASAASRWFLASTSSEDTSVITRNERSFICRVTQRPSAAHLSPQLFLKRRIIADLSNELIGIRPDAFLRESRSE